jgi:hypothetical protein
MMVRKKTILIVALICTAMSFSFSKKADAWAEGGFVGDNSNFNVQPVVWNFIKHFSYDRWQEINQWMMADGNNSHVDDMDIAFFGGHGNNWYFATKDYGYTFTHPWGDDNMEFAVFYSCCVVPSVRDRTDWYSPWYTPFAGLHQVIGFRNPCYDGDGAEKMANYYGEHVNACDQTLQTWINANNKYGSSTQLASMTYYPDAVNDSLCSQISDPPADSNWFANWYQYRN